METNPKDNSSGLLATCGGSPRLCVDGLRSAVGAEESDPY